VTINLEYLETNGLRLHTALAGPEGGEPVFLLHGFPEPWFCWEAQIEALAEAGFRVVAPDQRGYNLSDKPAGVASYRVDHLVDDVLGLADGLDYERFHLAAHDWGGMVAWNVARRHPERLKRLAIASAPHPAVMRQSLRGDWPQMRKSWYVFFFQIPGLPERFVRANNWRFLARAMAADLTEEERDRYRAAWAQPGAMTAMINWYRASMRRGRGSRGGGRIQVPTLVLWGRRDAFLGHGMASPSAERCQDGRLVVFEDASHWLLHDEARAVGELLIEHFRGQG
jgi:pimeloyl-ACP methyl ester carboxylesterase